MRRRRNRARHAVFIFSTPYEKLLNDANRRMQSGDHALKALKEPRAILIQSACLFPVTGKIVTPNGRVKCRPGRQDRSLHDAAFFRQSIELPDFLRSSFVIYVTILFALSDANSIAACPAHYFADPSPLHEQIGLPPFGHPEQLPAFLDDPVVQFPAVHLSSVRNFPRLIYSIMRLARQGAMSAFCPGPLWCLH